MNLVEAEVVDRGSQPVLRVEGTNALVPAPVTASPNELRFGRRVLLGLRPEWIALPGGERLKEATSLDFSVQVIEPTGLDVFVALKAGLKEIMARLPAGSAVKPGETRRFDIDLSKAILFDAESGVALKHRND